MNRLPSFPFLCLFLLFLLNGTGDRSTCHAQWRVLHQPGQNVTRWLGQGFSAGYHFRTPGPRTDYYQPFGFQHRYLLSGNAYPMSELHHARLAPASHSVFLPSMPGINGWDAPSEIEEPADASFYPTNRKPSGNGLDPFERSMPGAQPLVDQDPARNQRLDQRLRVPPRRQTLLDFDR